MVLPYSKRSSIANSRGRETSIKHSVYTHTHTFLKVKTHIKTGSHSFSVRSGKSVVRSTVG